MSERVSYAHKDDLNIRFIGMKGESPDWAVDEQVYVEPTDPIEITRARLRPHGTADLVRLCLKGDSAYIKTSLVQAAIDEIARLPMMVALGEEVSPLQQLAIMLLKDSAYIE